MEFIMGLTEIETKIDIVKIFFINVFTYYINYKLINKKIETNLKRVLVFIIVMMFVARMCVHIKSVLGGLQNMIFTVLLISIVFEISAKQRFASSLLLTLISLSINYVMFSISAFVVYNIFLILNVQEMHIGLLLILLIYLMIGYIFVNIKRFEKGIIFLQRNMNNEYIDILILNVSVIILFCITMLSNYNIISSNTFGFSLFIFTIIMFITIQKSLQLYYKQKLQEREVEEIKEELKNKDKEIEELEKENLKLNKKNHSIAHKQKSLEYELEQMVLNNQIMDGNHVKDKIESLSKEMQNEAVSVELTKTNIDKIDSMLKYMQSECVKNKIDFQLQINGNIHHMINKYIEKEDLEILIADLIKNAIIAINHSENNNKSILVRLGIIDGAYSLYVYDSGIEFEIDTLINLGVKPSTTHVNDGGTGMGWMNTFDTLKKYKASLVIEEYGKPVEDNFTKVIRIIFDKENTYKIFSYREEEIRERDVKKE